MIARNLSQLFLLSLIAVMGMLYVATIGDAAQETYLAIAALALIGLSMGLERLFPLHEDWNESRGDTLGDIGSFVLIYGALDGAMKWLAPFLVLAILPDLSTNNLPLWAQVVSVTLLIELGAWVSHWAHHRFQPLWALHAMHHSTERLYTLNNFRFHPLNHVINHLVMFLPLLALGFSKDAMLAYAALSLPVLLFQHSNIGFRFGALSFVLNTNTVHRWHHSAAYKEGMHNFGRALVIWDHLFGTFHHPSDTEEPKAIGHADKVGTYPFANQTIRQILWPFSKACCG